MGKKYKYTLFTAFLSVWIVFGSMFGMKQVLQMRERSLLTERGETAVEPPVRSWQKAEIDITVDDVMVKGNGGHVLTLKQVRNAIESWNNRRGEVVHDPVEGQISMEEAIRFGRIWIDSMRREMMRKSDVENIDYFLDAVLSVGKQKEETSGKLEPYFSFWTIQFISKEMRVTLYLNAVTGNVWNAKIIFYEKPSERQSFENLNLFVELAGMPIDDLETIKTNREETKTTLAIEDGLLYAQTECYKTLISDNRYYDIQRNGVDYINESFGQEYMVISYELLLELE